MFVWKVTKDFFCLFSVSLFCLFFSMTFVCLDRVPCGKNIQALWSIFINRQGFLCKRMGQVLKRSPGRGLGYLQAGCRVSLLVDLDEKLAVFQLRKGVSALGREEERTKRRTDTHGQPPPLGSPQTHLDRYESKETSLSFSSSSSSSSSSLCSCEALSFRDMAEARDCEQGYFCVVITAQDVAVELNEATDLMDEYINRKRFFFSSSSSYPSSLFLSSSSSFSSMKIVSISRLPAPPPSVLSLGQDARHSRHASYFPLTSRQEGEEEQEKEDRKDRKVEEEQEREKLRFVNLREDIAEASKTKDQERPTHIAFCKADSKERHLSSPSLVRTSLSSSSSLDERSTSLHHVSSLLPTVREEEEEDEEGVVTRPPCKDAAKKKVRGNEPYEQGGDAMEKTEEEESHANEEEKEEEWRKEGIQARHVKEIFRHPPQPGSGTRGGRGAHPSIYTPFSSSSSLRCHGIALSSSSPPEVSLPLQLACSSSSPPAPPPNMTCTHLLPSSSSSLSPDLSLDVLPGSHNTLVSYKQSSSSSLFPSEDIPCRLSSSFCSPHPSPCNCCRSFSLHSPRPHVDLTDERHDKQEPPPPKISPGSSPSLQHAYSTSSPWCPLFLPFPYLFSSLFSSSPYSSFSKHASSSSSSSSSPSSSSSSPSSPASCFTANDLFTLSLLAPYAAGGMFAASAALAFPFLTLEFHRLIFGLVTTYAWRCSSSCVEESHCQSHPEQHASSSSSSSPPSCLHAETPFRHSSSCSSFSLPCSVYDASHLSERGDCGMRMLERREKEEKPSWSFPSSQEWERRVRGKEDEQEKTEEDEDDRCKHTRIEERTSQEREGEEGRGGALLPQGLSSPSSLSQPHLSSSFPSSSSSSSSCSPPCWFTRCVYQNPCAMSHIMAACSHMTAAVHAIAFPPSCGGVHTAEEDEEEERNKSLKFYHEDEEGEGEKKRFRRRERTNEEE
ncbi:hypothetical protein CSUI_002501 [Cystoisospora suis]|uniref:Uncharacterized protein n=1 Tax=Cystoisospora suis TaxID=483139 RepID=A0A2C6L694_9APIC|nr:hypothetical protein CSUI_002501 [Cystoisospora suis]